MGTRMNQTKLVRNVIMQHIVSKFEHTQYTFQRINIKSFRIEYTTHENRLYFCLLVRIIIHTHFTGFPVLLSKPGAQSKDIHTNGIIYVIHRNMSSIQQQHRVMPRRPRICPRATYVKRREFDQLHVMHRRDRDPRKGFDRAQIAVPGRTDAGYVAVVETSGKNSGIFNHFSRSTRDDQWGGLQGGTIPMGGPRK